MKGSWVYPLLDNATGEAGMEEVETYVLRLQNTVSQYITTQSILEIYMVAEKWPGAQVTMRWWEQAGL